jgi:aminomethyltransferase
MKGKYVILCNTKGGILNDPVLLRLSQDEFWFSISDSSLMLWLQGVNVDGRFKVDINEIDVAPVQIQGPKSDLLMRDLAGDGPSRLPYYGLMHARIAGRDVVISRTGFSGENGYEIYLRDATKYAEDLWNAILEAGRPHNLAVIAPAHHRRIAAGILSWGQDMDHETLPFQCNLAYQVPKKKRADYIGKQRLEEVRRQIRQGRPPFTHTLVGMCLGGRPIEDYAPDFWLIAEPGSTTPCGYVTSPWYCPELQVNIAMGYVPLSCAGVGTRLDVHLPQMYADRPGEPVAAEVVKMPFRPSAHPSARELARAGRRPGEAYSA